TIHPGNNSCQRNPKPTRPNMAKPARGQTNWHWLIKHPVEFSKNNHTPKPTAESGTQSRGLFVSQTVLGQFRVVKLTCNLIAPPEFLAQSHTDDQ
ncbi:MAG TPA: hypothetical protein VGD43_09480, partial [Micromonospora sp.]